MEIFEMSNHLEESDTLTPHSERVSLLDILIILAKAKRIWIICAAVCGALGLGIGALMPVEYRAETDILPPQPSTSSATLLMGQVGSILGVGAGAGLGLKDPNDLIITILRSRTVRDGIIRQFDLQKVYRKPDLSLAEIDLAKHTKVDSTLQGAVAVLVDDQDPKRAAAIANAYVDQLHLQNERFALSEAGQRRLFYQRQLEDEKNALADAEVALKRTEQKTGVIELQGQTALALRSAADLRAQITTSELRLRLLLTSETPSNPDVILLQQQINTLQEDLKKVEADNGATDTANLPTSTVPEVALEYVRNEREVKYHEALFNLLARQYEAAKIDESKEAPAIEVIDPAVPPHFPYSPRRALLVAWGVAIGLVLGCFYVVAAEMIRRSLEEEAAASKWSALRRAIWS